VEGRHGLGRPAGVLYLLGAAQRVQQGVALPAHILYSMFEGHFQKEI